jgi:GTP diphosphokinase / guanosine-3',5'-bis(diphosphate) 3'-diphosphatase
MPTTIPEKYNLSLDEENKLILREYKGLLQSLKHRLKNKADKKSLREAFEKAVEAHKTTRRKSGEPYILHPIAVARIVVEEIGLGVRSAISALLHDTVEDTSITLDEIKLEFGAEIMRIIDGLTKITHVEESQTTTQQAENFRKVLLTMVDDPRVVLIKIADRLHNMRTMQSMARHKQLKISSETTFIYAPLAHRLGLYEIRTELEDLCLRYTEPALFNEITLKLQESKKEREKFIRDFIRPLKAQLDTNGFKFEIFGRAKSVSSIVNKIKTKNVSFEEVYDLFAIRIILDVPDLQQENHECWRAFGIVGSLYKPGQNRMRDWLSQPKGNGYEAIHNTFMSASGKWVEVQVRSKRMNEVAEKGIAAHWKYKEESSEELSTKKTRKKADQDTKQEHKLDSFLNHVRDMMSNIDNNSLEFIQDLKDELFKDEMYVYTPKGDMRVLAVGATALDFAFDIHSDIGGKCIGAKVNYKLVPISHVLRNGDQIEIITSSKQKPHADWLQFVITGKAKSRIRSFLNEEKRAIAEEGKEKLERKFKSLNFQMHADNLQEVINHFKFSSALDFYYAIAIGVFDLKTLTDFKPNTSGKLELIKSAKVSVKNIHDEIELSKQLPGKGFELILFGESSNRIKYKLANCCNPINGDDVFGFVTSSEGLKIHRTNCPNASSLLANYAHRIVKAKWAGNKSISFLTALRIIGLDDVGVINKITNVISGELKINMRSMSLESKDGVFEGTVTVFVHDKDELNTLCERLSDLNGIHSVTRLEVEED